MGVKRGRSGMTRKEMKVIIASSAGTVFEWYDFFLYGSLAAVIGAQYFSSFPEATRNIFALLAFAAGFLVRPLGAVIFGRLGDRVGRKYMFLATITIMGLSTFAVGFLPNYASIGKAAPIILIILRILQGLALGGEYGGAVTYVAEHAPQDRRGYFTSFINSTATLGLLLSLVVILVARVAVGEEAFTQWGWRIPFLFSILLLIISAYIRLQMAETPAFRKMKAEGARSKAPLKEAFGEWKHAKLTLAALFGIIAGQAVVWYTAKFYALLFLSNVLRVDTFTTNTLLIWSLSLGTVFYIFFGRLSDKIGRKPIIYAGFLLAALVYFPLFHFIALTANPALDRAQKTVSVILTADPADCTFQFNPVGIAKFTSSCDIAKTTLAKNSVNYKVEKVSGAVPAKVAIGAKEIVADPQKAADAFNTELNNALAEAGYPLAGKDNPELARLAHVFDIFRPQPFKLLLALLALEFLAAMATAPVASALAELFPTRIRYSGVSLPLNLGNGWFGGLMPAAAFAMIAQTGNVYYGLWYPVVVAVISAVIGIVFLPENYRKDIFADD
jgi:MFS family permease